MHIFDRLKDIFLNAYDVVTETRQRAILTVVTLVVIVTLVLGMRYHAFVSSAVPTVVGADFSLESLKIPYDVKSIDISFSVPLDPSTVNATTFSIEGLSGQATLRDATTVSYILSAPMVRDTDYTLLIGTGIASSYGIHLASARTIELHAVDSAHATRIIPDGPTTDLSTPIRVLFSVPMVPTTDLASRDRLPCPLMIDPAVEGTCHWIDTSVLEFVPRHHLEQATEYRLTVASTGGLLYPLSQAFTGTIRTPDLAFTVDDRFSPEDGITLHATAPVDPDEIRSHATITEGSGEALPVQVDPWYDADGHEREDRFVVHMPKGTYVYGSVYMLALKAGIHPLYGTIATATGTMQTVSSRDFVDSHITVTQDTYDDSGTLSATKDYNLYDGEKKLSPTDRIRSISVSFATGVTLDSKLIQLVDANNAIVSTHIAYAQRPEYKHNQPTGKTINDTTTLRITPMAKLSHDMDYRIVVSSTMNPFVGGNVVRTFHTTPAFIVTGYTQVTPTEACITTSSRLSPGMTLSGAVTAPASRPLTILDNKDCPAGYPVSTRLAPQSVYTVTIPAGVEDGYGSPLVRAYHADVQTTDLSPQDQYLYTTASRDRQIIPSDQPLVVQLQTMNISSIHMDVCQMDIDGYIQYRSMGNSTAYQPTCIAESPVAAALRPSPYWHLGRTDIDIEKDILQTKLTTPFVLVRGATKFFNQGENGYRDDQREFATMTIRENLSLMVEKAADRSILFTTTFDGQTIPMDLVFDVYSYDDHHILQKVDSDITWNADKKYYDMATVPGLAMIVAHDSAYWGILDTDTDSTSNYDFKYISGQDTETRDYLYLTTDRPLYRGGDTVSFKGLLRTFTMTGYTLSSTATGILRVLSEDNKPIKEMTVWLDKRSNISGDFVLPADMPLGRVHFEYIGRDDKPVYNNGELYIENYKKPVFKVNIDAPAPDAMLGDSIDLKGHSEYYFGGRLPSSAYQYTVLAQDYFFDAKDYDSYQFGENEEGRWCLLWGSCAYHDEFVDSSTGVTDADGSFHMHSDYPTRDATRVQTGSVVPQTSTERIYTYAVQVTDPDTGRTVENRVNQILHTTDAYVGLRADYFQASGTGVQADGIVLGYDAQPVADRDVTVELYRRQWKDIKKQGIDGAFYHESSAVETKEFTEHATSDAKGRFSVSLQPQSSGEYRIRATYMGTNGAPYTTSVTVYVAGEAQAFWNTSNNSLMDIVADRTTVAPGETAGFTLQSPVATGSIFVAVEKDDGILDAFVQGIRSASDHINIPIQDTYYPNVYVKVYLIGRDGVSPLPIYRRALGTVKVSTTDKNLAVTIVPEKTRYAPGAAVKLTVHVRDSAGHPVNNANGSLAVVDESLLALMGNPKKNPYGFFYEMKRYLGVDTIIGLVDLVDRLAVKSISGGEKGGAGDGEKGGDSLKKRGTFKDTAYWSANYTTDSKGDAVITTDALPDNLTTWAIESIVSDGSMRIGVGNTSIMTSQAVMVEDDLPRFFGSSDTITLAPVVFNRTDRDQSFTVTLSGSSMTVDRPSRVVKITKGTSASVPFIVRIADTGMSTGALDRASMVDIIALSEGTDSDEVERTIPIRPTATMETVSTMGHTSGAGYDEHVDITPSTAVNGLLTIGYAPTLLSQVTSGTEFLETFPYGCSEQRTSAIASLLLRKDLYDAAGMPLDLKKQTVRHYVDAVKGYESQTYDDLITAYLVDIAAFQQADGGFDYWKDMPTHRSDYRLTAEILSTLAHIQMLRYPVDQSMLDRAVGYLQDETARDHRPDCTVSAMNTCSYPLMDRLHALRAILDARHDSYDAYRSWKTLRSGTGTDMTDIDSRIEDIRLVSRLLHVFSLTQDDRTALSQVRSDDIKAILNDHLVLDSRGSYLGHGTAGDRLRRTSGFLLGLAESGSGMFVKNQSILDPMRRWIITQKHTDGSYGSTADTRLVLSALTASLIGSADLADTNMQATLRVNGSAVATQTIDNTNKLATFSQSISASTLPASTTVRIETTGSGSIYYDITLGYMVPAVGIAARNEGFIVQTQYYDYAEYRRIRSLKDTEWKQYLAGDIDYESLQYPREVTSYLTGVTSGRVGQLLYVADTVIAPEAADQVAVEAPVPSGSELVNTTLQTESSAVALDQGKDRKGKKIPSNPYIKGDGPDREEYRDEQYFTYDRAMDAGVYHRDYVLRLTHAGTYHVLPTRAFEFYHPETFGRSAGRDFVIEAMK